MQGKTLYNGQLPLVVYNNILRCNRCGVCQQVCPTYQQSMNEMQVARGRVRMLRMLEEGQWDWRDDKGMAQAFDNCLLCGACFSNCPAAVETHNLLAEARHNFSQHKGFPLFHRLMYRGMLSRQERLERASLLMRLYQGLGLAKALAADAAQKAFSRLSYLNSFLPDLSAPARRQMKSHYVPDGRPLFKAAYFLGCATNVFFADTAKALAGYLVSQGVEVFIPRLLCCGGPHYAAGDREKARQLASANVEVLESLDADFIVSDCATCAHSLHSYDKLFAADDPLQPRLARLAAKVLDINTLLREKLPANQGLRPLAEVVTYHDPCHAVRGLNIKAAPRALLAAIPGLELREMRGADSCCGGAGSYWLTHAEMSERIVSNKLDAIAATGAGMVASSCPACVMQLGAAARRHNMQVRVLQPVELLAQSAGVAMQRS